MKSLNRTLSLVLVLVMVLGLVGISAGASFKDEDKINYKEAVGVMTGIGALVGYPDGTFNGAGTVTREEAVKTVVYSVLGADVAKNLAGTATGFADVDAGRWSSGVIAYAVSRGIVNGRDAKTFDPTGNVTANEVGKMMLCAAGYGKKGEFIGSSWELNTAVLANKTGLYTGSKAANYSAPATREETALYTFNGITNPKAIMMEYNKVFDTYIAAGTGVGVGVGHTIAEVVYPTLKGDLTTDALGRPATQWTYKGKEIGKYASSADLTFTARAAGATPAEQVSAMGIKNYTLRDGSVTPTINGVPGTAVTTLAGVAALTKNGTVVQLIVDATNKTQINNIVVIETELAKITKINAATKTVTVEAMGGAKYTANADNATYKALSAMKADDYVLVNHIGTTIANIALPTVVTGKLTNVGTTSGAVSSVTVAGKAYAISEKQTGITAGMALSDKKDVTLYVDSFGYAINIKDVATTTSYFAVAKVSSAIVNNVVVKMATGYATDGSVVTLNVGNQDVEPNTLYSYRPATAAEVAGTDAEYKITAVAAVADNAQAANGTYAPSNAAIAAGATMFTGNDATNPTSITAVPYSPAVKFIFFTDNGVVVKNGVQAVAVGNIAKVRALYTGAGTATDPLLVSAVYVMGVSPVDAVGANVLYLASSTGTSYVNGAVVNGYIALIDGVPTPINVKSSETTGLFYTYAKDEKTSVYTVAAYNGTASAANKTKTNDQFSALTAGYILDTVAAADGATASIQGMNAAKANIVDLTKTGVDTLADIAAAKAAGKTVIMSIIYDDLATSATYKTVKQIYVVSVVKPVVTPAVTGDNLTWDATSNKYKLNLKTVTNAVTMNLEGLPTGVAISASASSATDKATAVFASGVVTVTGVAEGDTNITLTTAAGKIIIPVTVVDLA